MAWFKRNRDGPPAGDTVDPAAVAPAFEPEPAAPLAAPPPAAPPSVSAPAWATAAPMPLSMPTIQRVLGRVDARAATTLGRPAPLLLAPLGHAVVPDAPTGSISAVTVDGGGPGAGDQPPLEYVQRAPANAVAPRPAVPAQLLVPSFQPARIPSLPVVPPAVQRAPGPHPSLTTAPDPSPPLVLPVGEVLSVPVPPAEPGPPPGAEPGSADSAPGEAPLLAGTVPAAAGPATAPALGVQRAPAAALPLVPVQRHADHPGHVDGDEAPAAPDDVQRAPAPTVAPLLAEPSEAPAGPVGHADTRPTPVPAPDLPLAPVQRHADHPGHVEGDTAPDDTAGIQRAPADGPPPPAAPALPAEAPSASAPPADAPLLAGAPIASTLPAAADVPPSDDTPGAAAAGADLPLAGVQRAPTGTPPAAAEAPLHSAAAIASTSPSDAPLLASAPIASTLPAAADVPPSDDTRGAAAPGADLPLAGVQRAPVGTPPVAAEAPLLADAPIASTLPAATADVPPAVAASPAPGTPDPTPPHVDLPLAPVQRQTDHANHPGHVEGDEAPDVQRSAAELASGPAPTAPLVGDAAPLASTPPAAPPAATQPATAPGPSPAPDMPLPGAPVQRRAAPRRPAGLGRPIGAVPTGAVEPGTVQRAPTAPAATAPLVGSTPAQPSPAMPLAGGTGAGPGTDGGDDAPGAAGSPTPDAPSLDLVQREPAGAMSPAVPAAAEGLPTAPLVGGAPLEPTFRSDPAAEPGPVGAPGPGVSSELDLVQRAPLGAGGASASAGTTASSSSSAATPVSATLAPLVVAPLLGGRPFATQVQRASAGAGSAPAGLVDRSGPEALSPEPGRVYQPLAGIGMWNGAPPPDLAGPAVEAPPARVAAAVQRATATDLSNVRIRDHGPTAQRLQAPAISSGSEAGTPAAVGSPSSGEGPGPATRELVHAGRPSAPTEYAGLSGLELPPLPLVPPSASPTVQRAPSEGGGSSPFSSQQLNTLLELADNPRQDLDAATVQRAIGGHRPSSAAPIEAPPQETPAAAADKQQTPQELEELATKLFPALRNLFRSELLGFRRRSGTSSDRPLS